eukprot:6808477-Ditylum_brightwellii.AAC.1
MQVLWLPNDKQKRQTQQAKKFKNLASTKKGTQGYIQGGAGGSDRQQVFAFQCLQYLLGLVGLAVMKKRVHQSQMKAKTNLQVLVIAAAKDNNRRKLQR